MKILVTGANGFVGQCLCAELLKRRNVVRGAFRSASSLSKSIDGVIVGPINGETNWGEALCGMDTVIHLAARVHVMKDVATDSLAIFRDVNLHGTENLARQLVGAGVKRLVYVSSVKVNGEATHDDRKFSAADIPLPQDPYGISKWEAEQALCRVAEETGLEVVVVRPPLVYGPGVKGNFAQMLSVVAQGIPLPLASVSNLRSLVYVENLADALIACATHPAAVGQAYLVSDGVDVSTPDLLRHLAAEMGVPSRLFPCPLSLLHLFGALTRRSLQVERLLGSLRIDSAKMRQELNWVPPYTLQQGVRATAEWYRNQN